jgi:DNA-binding MarR family transcriptional regulator
MDAQESENARIMLGLLESVERDGTRSQRSLAAECGVALGLVNAYLRRCIRKGLIKVADAPARRYTYYLTPQGFAEKSRLAVEYLSYSLSFFRHARSDCTAVFEEAKRRGWSRMALLGISDLAEISTICALESGITIVGIVDASSTVGRFVGTPIFGSIDAVPTPLDGVMVTDIKNSAETYLAAVARIGANRVAAPALLGLSYLAPGPSSAPGAKSKFA